MIEFKTPAFEEFSTREWLVTNGIGGYASSTLCGTNTRRYHGILVASFNPPTERKVIVSKVDESIMTGKEELKLSTNQYVNADYPEGFRHITQFDKEPLPSTLFNTGEYQLLKTVFMVYNSNTTVIEYKNTGSTGYRLWLNPLYAARDYHSLLHENQEYKFKTSVYPTHQAIEASDGLPPFYFKYTAGTFTEGRTWHKGLKYQIDASRGQDHVEDVFSTGYVEHQLEPGQSLFLIFTFDENILNADPEKLKQNEIERLSKLVPQNINDKFLSDLIISGDQFIVHRRSTSNYSIIAGYHWFTDWGRDSMIALRGLCIATGRQKEAASVILTFLAHLKDGIIPNRFPDAPEDEPEYHTIDATLWLFIAVYEYDEKFNDLPFLQNIFSKLSDILQHHLNGTKHNIHVTVNGLLCGGIPGLPLTWMDARIDNHSFTPRKGCPVEINALWYNALKIYAHVSAKINAPADGLFLEHATRIKKEFVKFFWNHNGYLNDYITPNHQVDSSIRPNQIYAVSLPFSILSKEKEKQVVDTVAKKLLTAYGLRTLDPAHPDFKKCYDGDVWSRDGAYHQGTVWPFLLPEYFAAYLKVNNYSESAKKNVEAQLDKLKTHFYNEGCVHGIAEIFDGLNPQEGKGCMHQAWSVSNLILLMIKNNLSV